MRNNNEIGRITKELEAEENCWQKQKQDKFVIVIKYKASIEKQIEVRNVQFLEKERTW